MRVTFFAHKPLEAIQRVGFYSQDVQILRELGHEVRVANSFTGLLAPADLYFIWWWTAAFLPVTIAELRGIPAVITGVFNYDLADVQQTDYLRRPWWHKRLIRWSARKAKANIFVSKYEHDLVTSNVHVPHAHVVPLVVDTNLYAPLQTRTRDSQLVLNVAWSGASNAHRKCLFEIVESIPIVRSKFPDVRYAFCGTPGDAFVALRQRAHDLEVQGSVDFLGYVSEKEKLALMQNCAVYLSPSRYEGFGLAIAEAMSCEAAVVSSPVGSVPEVVGEHGLMVSGSDVMAIAEATMLLLSDPARAKQIGARARSHVEQHFGFSSRRESLRAILDTAAASGSKPEPR